MEFTWSETKRAANIKAHGLDFLDAVSVFEGVTFSFEDDRFSYGEQRFVTLGLLAGITVSVVHTENENGFVSRTCGRVAAQEACQAHDTERVL